MSEWQKIELEKFITFQRGFDIVKRDMEEDGLYDVIFSSGFGGKHDQFKVKAPGVIIGRKGTLGSVFYCDTDFWPTDTTLWVKDFHKNHPKFAYYFLKTLKFEQYDCGSANPTLNRNHIHTLEVSIPKSPEEQKRIAAVLSCLDAKIDNLRRQNETLEKIAQTLFKHWFIDFEFPNDEGKPYKSSGGAMSPSELGDIPAGWKVLIFQECLKHLIDNRGKTPQFFESGIPALSAKFVKGGFLINQDSFNYVALELFDSSEKLEVGDIIMTSEAPLGELFYIAKNTNYYPAQRVFALRANPEIISPSYFNYWLASPLGQSLIKRRGTGSTVQGIKQSELYKCEVLIPKQEIMERASGVFSQVLLKKEVNGEQIQILAKTRDTLLPKLMSGQIRIKE
ncbi:restriction modification system DNA specificity domain protein [Sphaerospermopsis reniformis]|uniref:Restriction modification system DNA specificity domain protein n=1 Tax=Sphaerospermopsis reniformis TaxID=531300 RepID=A0A480A7C3_9CYAN|nr:restriction endonuclease subunit S [Sphaerospermopsis reniformis]GCL39613.1 restriction modification system DNA specificity domain protein [Sphaerospermopsis reniformis]